jgi:His-Xaa-Ser system radical SAM maturase HxsB
MAALTFRDRPYFVQRLDGYRLLPFRFMELDGRQLLVNEVGEHLFLDQETFDAFVSHGLQPAHPGYDDLKSKHFLWDTPSDLPIRLLATKYRTKKSFLAGFTGLHIFVVTLRCDHSCHYCQVSRVSPNRSKYDMSAESATKALDLVFRSPANPLKIEFQGGEPLLNFELIRFLVREARVRANAVGRDVEFVLATNLVFLTDEILEFLRDNKILVSTSLDGPAFLHNANRPRPGGDSYELAVRGIQRVREVLGFDRVSALMTTSRLSLEHPQAIVDEYVTHGFDHIFLRPISPYGFAVRTRHKTGYELEAFLTFYKKALAHIIEINRAGRFLVEDYAQILLTKILTPFPTGYVDLQSPAGVGIGVVVYNYDGDVYVSDEARMLAEMGDRSFRLGGVHTHTYEELFGGELLKSLVSDSVIESLPGCADCAFQPYCGCDPIENYSVQGSVIGHRPTSNFHMRNLEIIKHLFRLYYGADPFVKRLFWSWVQNRPVAELVPPLER